VAHRRSRDDSFQKSEFDVRIKCTTRSLEANKAYAVAGFPVFRFDLPACRLKCPCLRILGNWSKGIEFWAQNAAREPLEWIGLKVFPVYFPGGRELKPNARN
ncbi:MAG: hypothetical protein WAL36_04580, partial [Pseudolabrys sp.]